MIAIKFEMLSLMTTMNAVGLMPDDDYQREKARLVSDLVTIGSRTIPLDIEKWHSDGFSPNLESSKLQWGPEDFDISERMPFDWKAIISNFLESAYRSSHITYFESHDRNIKTEAVKLGIETESQKSLSGTANSLMEHAYARRQIMELKFAIDDLRAEVRQLRKAVAARSSSRADIRVTNTEPSKNSRSGEIESLQKDMQRLLTAAALCDAKGDFYGAGSHRGAVAKIESKLRALGA
jgi:hypothetical protein